MAFKAFSILRFAATPLSLCDNIDKFIISFSSKEVYKPDLNSSACAIKS